MSKFVETFNNILLKKIREKKRIFNNDVESYYKTNISNMERVTI